MATFVLVGGFWLGAWSWDGVARRLRALGHDVWPVTLTGLGDRVHLARPEVRLETQFSDVINTVVCNDLRDVVLVGHSAGGMIVSGAAERLAERLAGLVYVDSGPLPAGTAIRDSYPPDYLELFERLAAEQGDGWRIPLPPFEELGRFASLEGIDAPALARWRALATPQPLSIVTQPLPAAAALRNTPSTLIACSIPLPAVREMIAAGHPWFAAITGPNWHLEELPTGHWPMFSRPDDLANLLNDCASA